MTRAEACEHAQRQADEWQCERWVVLESGATGWRIRNPAGKATPMTVVCRPTPGRQGLTPFGHRTTSTTK